MITQLIWREPPHGADVEASHIKYPEGPLKEEVSVHVPFGNQYLKGI